jgi:hypothetical protein
MSTLVCAVAECVLSRVDTNGPTAYQYYNTYYPSVLRNGDSGLSLTEGEVMESFCFVKFERCFMNPWNYNISTCLQNNLDTMQTKGS